MSEPTTEAGRRLLDAANYWQNIQSGEYLDIAQMARDIAAIEAEARKAALVEHRCDALEAGRVAGRADLASRIEARVVGLDRFVYDGDACLFRDEVLAIIREEAAK